MNKVNQYYQVVDKLAHGDEIVGQYETRQAARKVYKKLGGAEQHYILKQITEVQVEKQIR